MRILFLKEVLSIDKEVILGCQSTQMQHSVRIIQVVDSSNGELFHIVTNRFDLTAEEIAQIYRLW
jgi:hypothetical protein